MRGRMVWIAPSMLALVAGCSDYHPVVPQASSVRPALITAIRYPQGVAVDDDVTIRYTVVINPCEEFYFAQDRPDGDAMRFTAFTVPAPCTTALPTTREVEFLLQAPQRLPRALIFDEPDHADSIRVLSAYSGR